VVERQKKVNNMKRMLVNATQPDELRVAITDDALLIDLDIEHPGSEQKKSNIYKGRITKIEPSLGAVFVDYGSERHGFLPIKDVSREYFLTEVNLNDEIDIRKVLKEGQELVVQVEKEERGNKGAALTTFISLAGSYLVLMANNPRAAGISRRIEGEEREHIKALLAQLNIPEGMGAIIRTAGVDKSSDELKWDLEILLRYWEAIKKAAIAKPGPYLIHQEGDVIIRAIRDYLRYDIEEIIIDEAAAYERAKNYINQVRPDYLDKLKLYNDHLPLFSRFQIEQQTEEAYQRELRLPAGGSIVIDLTEALVSIDINSAKATKGGNIEETAYNTNLEAADEIARQLRIRDVGGLIVIDFIDMLSTRNQRNVENRLRDAMHIDRARIQIGRISRFGLLEMSRQRLRASLTNSTQTTCPRCSGSGTVRGVESMALSVIHLIQEHAAHSNNVTLQVQLPVDTATYLLNEKRNAIKDIETHTQATIIIIPNANLETPQYQIKEIKDERTRTTPSYHLPKIPKAESVAKRSSISKKSAEPVVNAYLKSNLPAPRKSSGGVIKRLWDLMFGPDELSRQTKKPAARKSTSQRKTTPRRNPSQSGRPPAQKRSSSTKKPTEKNTTRRGNRGSGTNRPNENREKTATQSRPAERKPTITPKPEKQRQASPAASTSSIPEKKSTEQPAPKPVKQAQTKSATIPAAKKTKPAQAAPKPAQSAPQLEQVTTKKEET
jgi:ribonuclease E